MAANRVIWAQEMVAIAKQIALIVLEHQELVIAILNAHQAILVVEDIVKVVAEDPALTQFALHHIPVIGFMVLAVLALAIGKAVVVTIIINIALMAALAAIV